MRTAFFIFPIAILLASCATSSLTTHPVAPTVSTPNIEVSEATEGCSVYVYRNKTAFQFLNPEKPFVYVGEERVGKLGIGNSICLQMVDGKYNISVKAPIAFMPAYTVCNVEIEVRAGAPVYVRYANEISGWHFYGASEGHTIQVVTDAYWRDRL